jgi:hypothetical protein
MSAKNIDKKIEMTFPGGQVGDHHDPIYSWW